MYRLIKQEGAARRGEFVTVHGTVQTPAFMNVATAGAIKGAVSAYDLKDIHCQVQLCNTYHLHLRPGDETVKKLGGIRKFTGWEGPVLTDSGGFQVFSLAKLRNIKEEGVTFASHVDGHRIFMGPEESMGIQSNLGSTIAMAFDECVENPAPRDYVEPSCQRTLRWLERCKREHDRLNSLPDCVNPGQLLFRPNEPPAQIGRPAQRQQGQQGQHDHPRPPQAGQGQHNFGLRPGGAGLHLEQVVEGHPKELAHGDELVNFRNGPVHLPAGDGLAGDPQLLPQSFLGEVILLSQFLNALA